MYRSGSRFWAINNQQAQKVYFRQMTFTQAIVELKLGSDRKRLAVTSSSGTEIWDVSNGTKLLSIPSDPQFWGTSFSPDGTLFAGVIYPMNSKPQIKLLDLTPVGEVLAITAQTGPAWGIAFGPIGTRMATESGSEGVARIWDVSSGKELLSISAPDICCSITFNSDGKRLATATKNGKGQIWDSTTGKLQLELVGHSDEVQKIAFKSK